MNPSLCCTSWLAAVGCLVAPDLILPGYRPVTHELVLEASPHFERLDFFAAPVRGFGGWTHIVPGAPFTFSSKYGTRIFALDKGAAFPDERGAGEALARAVGTIPVSETSAVPLTSPIESVLTRLRIVSVEDGVVRLEVASESEEWDMSVLAIAGGGLAVGLAGLVLIGRARRRATVARTQP